MIQQTWEKPPSWPASLQVRDLKPTLTADRPGRGKLKTAEGFLFLWSSSVIPKCMEAARATA